MVFCNKTATVRYLQHILGSEPEFSGSYATLSKDIDETERQRVLERFHRGSFPLLLCSDLASRGIDTSKAVNVVNYEFPNNVRYVMNVVDLAAGAWDFAVQPASEVLSALTLYMF